MAITPSWISLRAPRQLAFLRLLQTVKASPREAIRLLHCHYWLDVHLDSYFERELDNDPTQRF